MAARVTEQPDVAANLATVKAEIAAEAEAAGRPAGSVSLVAVAKTQSAERIRPALKAGQRVFGENRVQEAESKWPSLKADYPDARLHLIGPLQSNKAGHAVRLFDVIETVDRPEAGPRARPGNGQGRASPRRVRTSQHRRRRAEAMAYCPAKRTPLSAPASKISSFLSKA